MSSSAGYRPEIDGLRALSIAFVVLFHAGVQSLAGGFIGVDVFFVLSGYLITGLLVKEAHATGTIDLLGFFARRIRRLLPLSSFVMLVTLALGLWLQNPLKRMDLVDDSRAAALYLANWRFGNQITTYSDTEVTDGLLLHYWSLSIEEQFYFLWPILLSAAVVFARRCNVEDLSRWILFPALALVAASFLISVRQTLGGAGAAYYSTFGRLWEMGVGAALALLLPRLGRCSKSTANITAVAGLVLIVFAATTYDGTTSFPGFAALAPVGGTALILTSMTNADAVIGRLLACTPLPQLGKLSYAWYLWHWPAIGVGLLARERWGFSQSVEVVTALAVLLSLALSWLSHHLVENPMRHARMFVDGYRPSFLLGLILMVVPLSAGWLFGTFGNTGEVSIALPSATSQPVPTTVPETPRPAIGMREEAASTPPEVSVPPSTDSLTPMTPQDAADDWVGQSRPALRKSECYNGLEAVAIANTCVFGDPDGDVTILALGDSHMQHILPALHDGAVANGWRVVGWMKGDCPLVPVRSWSRPFERPFTECEEWRKNLSVHLEGLTADAVVIGRSFFYERILIDEQDNLIEDTELIAKIWEDAYRELFERLTAQFGNVLVFRDTPWPLTNAADCLAANANDPSECAFAWDQHVGLDQLLYEAEVAAVGFEHHVDLSLRVCEVDPCQVITAEGIIKFRDTNHMTSTFAATLAPEVAAAVEALLSS